MKNKMKTWLSAAALALTLGAVSCSEDTTIDPTVGVSASELNVTKRGVSYEGGVISFDVTSNVYWIISNADDFDWLSVTPEAGFGSTTVQVRVDLNAEGPRTARLKIETKDGAAAYVDIKQASSEEVMTYLIENFGTTTDSNLPIGAFQQWDYSGAGTTGATYRYAYEGENAYVSKENPSDYTAAPKSYKAAVQDNTASGGNNILFGTDGATFQIKNFNAQSERNFRMQFAATNPAGTVFSKDDFKLQISDNGEYWFDMEYSRPAGDGWALSELQFNIPESRDRLLFRFTGKEGYRLDDVQIVEGIEDEDNQAFDFIYIVPGFRGLPATWDLATLTTSDENGQSWVNDRTIASLEDSKQGSTLFYYKDPANVHANNKYAVSGSNPVVTGANKGDYWLFTLPVQNAPANTSVSIQGTMRSSGSGPKFYIVEYSADGTTWREASGVRTTDVTCTNGASETGIRYHYTMNKDGATDTKISKVVTFAEPVVDGKFYIRLRISSAVNAAEAQLLPTGTTSTTRLTGQWSITEEKLVEGLPVYWSYPEDGVATGLANMVERYCYCDDYTADKPNVARIDALRTVAPTGNGTSPNMSYTVGASAAKDGEIGRLLMYGFALDDNWQFTIPVKNFKAGTKVNLKAILSSSPSGPKFYIAEYSTDNGATWKLGNTPKSIEDKATNDTETRTITYSYMMPDSPSNADCPVDETLTIAETPANENLMLRLRVCDAMAANKAKNITPNNGGTTRIKVKADICDKISVTIVE